MNRNLMAIRRIQDVPLHYSFRFVMIGDTYTAPSPAAEARFAQLRSQIKQLDPIPLFVVNLGDFAYPGTLSRHEPYCYLIDEFEIPTITIIGNHELDDPSGYENYHRFYGEENFYFDYGNTRFIVIYSAYGKSVIPGGLGGGPRTQDLAFLEDRLKGDTHTNRIVFMHVPPYLGGHYEQYPVAGSFKDKEREFLALVEGYKVKMVGCAHVLAFDKYFYKGVHYLVSGGGGADLRAQGRNIFHHFVLITINKSGQITGNVIKINEGTTTDHDFDFTIS